MSARPTSPPSATGERAYYCTSCGAFLLTSALDYGVLKGVFCRQCRRRQHVYLGGVRAGEDATGRNGQGEADDPGRP